MVSVVLLTEQQLKSRRYKIRDGVWHKLCTGPAHSPRGEWLPATDKYYIFKKTDGRPVAQCRLCHNWAKLKDPQKGSLHGYVPVAAVRNFYIEAVNRVGAKELSRRSGVSMGHILHVLTDDKKQYVEKATLRKIMLELVSMQRRNEFTQDERSRWRTHRRNNNGRDTCPGCGGLKSSITRNCKTCRDRFSHRHRNGEISDKEWEAIKIEFFPTGRNLIHGAVVK